jgi:membrane-bound acyltransferase YfiQ involved in biofilm formation
MMNSPTKVFGIITFLQAIILIYEFYFRQYTGIVALDIFNSIYWKTLFGWFFYFISGGIIAYHYGKFVELINRNIKPIVILYIISLILFMGEVYIDVYTNNSIVNFEKYGSIRPMNMFFGFMSFVMLVYTTRKFIHMKSPIALLVKSFGTYSLGVYFAHPMILEYIKRKLIGNFPNHIGYGRISSLIIILVLGWILTMTFCYIVALFNNRWILIGRTPQLKSGEKIKQTVS